MGFVLLSNLPLADVGVLTHKLLHMKIKRNHGVQFFVMDLVFATTGVGIPFAMVF